MASFSWFLSCARHSAQVTYGVEDWGTYIDDSVKYPVVLDESDNEGVGCNIEE